MIPERLYRRVMDRAVPSPFGCLVSEYSIGSHGYPQIGWSEHNKTQTVLCHRVVWEHHNGEIPEGQVIDHTCHNRLCVEIEHLRLLSNFENARRTSGRDWPLGTCINGHPAEHLYRQPSGRVRCRLCVKEYNRRYQATR